MHERDHYYSWLNGFRLSVTGQRVSRLRLRLKKSMCADQGRTGILRNVNVNEVNYRAGLNRGFMKFVSYEICSQYRCREHVREFAGLRGVQGGVAGDALDTVVCVEVLVEGDLEDGSGSLAE